MLRLLARVVTIAALGGCGPEQATMTATTATTAGSGTTATSAATTDGEATTSASSEMDGAACEQFLDEAGLPEQIEIAVRNDAPVPLFLPFGVCTWPLPYEITSLADGSAMPPTDCPFTCERGVMASLFCPQGCGSAGSILLAPGAVFTMRWDGRLAIPEMLPAACWDGAEDRACEVLRVAESGEYRVTVHYAEQLLGCDPDPCMCDLAGLDTCQVWPSEDAVGQFSAERVFTLPHAGPIELGLTLKYNTEDQSSCSRTKPSSMQ